EIDAYPGMLALVAGIGLLGTWRAIGAWRWRIWYGIGAIGLIIGLGDFDPVTHLLAHVPVVNLSRLPSRALILFSLAASVLLAHWIEAFLARSHLERSDRVRWRRMLTELVGPVAVVGLILATTLGGRTVAEAVADGLQSGWSLA